MKRFLALLCGLTLAVALCGGALAQSLGDIQIPSLNDLLVSHRVLLADESDTYEEYIVLFYAEGSHVLTQLNDETHFHKDAGYTLEYLKSQDYSQYYPGIESMDFADVLVNDAGDYFSVVVRFKKLDYLTNMDAMQASGILSGDPDAPVYDADYVAESLIASGMRELSVSEYGGKGIDFTVE